MAKDGKRGGLLGIVERYARGMRFPTLFALALAVFIADLIIPDLIPAADEVLLGLLTLLIARIKRRDLPEAKDQPTT